MTDWFVQQLNLQGSRLATHVTHTIDAVTSRACLFYLLSAQWKWFRAEIVYVVGQTLAGWRKVGSHGLSADSAFVIA